MAQWLSRGQRIKFPGFKIQIHQILALRFSANYCTLLSISSSIQQGYVVTSYSYCGNLMGLYKLLAHGKSPIDIINNAAGQRG